MRLDPENGGVAHARGSGERQQRERKLGARERNIKSMSFRTREQRLKKWLSGYPTAFHFLL